MITSTSNAQIKELAKLQKKSRLRDERRIFLVEGPRMVEEIPKERIERLYISESFERKNPAYIRELGMPAEVLSDPVFSYVSDTKNPQGILCFSFQRRSVNFLRHLTAAGKWAELRLQ